MTVLFYVKQGLVILTLAAMYGFEHLSPFYSGRGKIWSHDLRNIAIGILNVGITTIAFSSLTLYVTSQLSAAEFGLLRIVNLPRAVKIVISIVCIDLYMYWWHRLNHRFRFLWLFHRVHHSDPFVNVTSSYRFHIIEVAISLVGRLALIALLGVDMFAAFLYEMIFSPIVYFHHSNIAISETVDRFLRMVVPSPHMHRVHHSTKQKETDSNYGSVLSVWDRMFRSFNLVDDPRAINQGLIEYKDASHHTIIGMLKTPFIRV